MATSFIVFGLLLLVILLIIASITWTSVHQQWANLSRRGVVVSAIPSIIMLILFYSLAIHMRVSLGGWPQSIGEVGFPGPLVAHAHISCWYFSTLLLVSLVAWPVVIALLFALKRLRKYIPHASLFELVFFICFLLMLIAPARFLNWWWD